jgi:endonuclease/exonuclease/phosphatase family metal-dependent hydrolase
VRQVERLAAFVREHVPPNAPVLVAGDYNDWGERLDVPMRAHGLKRAAPSTGRTRAATFPSRLPVFTLDRVYVRGLRCTGVQVPRGPSWARMSDHLPLVVELALE